jgi:hypothetical protein
MDAPHLAFEMWDQKNSRSSPNSNRRHPVWSEAEGFTLSGVKVGNGAALRMPTQMRDQLDGSLLAKSVKPRATIATIAA